MKTVDNHVSSEIKECMKECKRAIMETVTKSCTSDMDMDDFVFGTKVLVILERMTNVFADMIGKQDMLMDKMDKVMDKYLEQK